jgi:putative protease
MERKKPELLAPAGDFERLEMAILYGANAVYLAGNDFGMRAFAGNFNEEQLKHAVALAKSHSVTIHVTCNITPRNAEAARLPAFLELLNEIGVDAVIAADPGVFALAQRHAPKIAIHVSTQAGVTNYESARAWHDMGASRVILARELSLEELSEIRQKTPKELELECFVHGAMCVSYSGRCLLSEYMTGRDASRGACAQPCRYQYALVEEKRPGQYFAIREEDGETYILNSRDMCMIDHIPDLIAIGMDSLKIEGRAKSAYYTAAITGAYRNAIDAAAKGQAPDPMWRDEVEKVSHRPYSTGFFYGSPGQFTENSQYLRDFQVVAVVEDCDGEGNALCSLRNKFSAGEVLDLLSPKQSAITLTAPMMEELDGSPLEIPRHPQMKFKMKLPVQAPRGAMLRICRDN